MDEHQYELGDVVSNYLFVQMFFHNRHISTDPPQYKYVHEESNDLFTWNFYNNIENKMVEQSKKLRYEFAIHSAFSAK